MIRPQMFQILFLIVANSIVLQSQPLDDDLWKNVIDDFYKAGPYNTFCNRTEPPEKMPPDPKGNFYPCQLQCSCDPFTCGSELLCCPDIPEKNETFRNTSCLYPVMYQEPADILFKDPRRHVKFPIRMVHGCNDEYIGSELHEECLSYRSMKDLKNLLPVISNKTGLVYVNSFCAECSDDLNFTQFEPIFACRESLFHEDNWEFLALERTYENQIYLIKEGQCVFIFKPPDGRKLENYKCVQVEINSCNQSGISDVQDPYYEAACGAYELPYQFGASIYRNYHCLICNMPQNWNVRSLCINNHQYVLRVSFYALINLDQTDVTGFDLGTTENDKQLCGNTSGEVFDKYLVSLNLLNGKVFRINHVCCKFQTLKHK